MCQATVEMSGDRKRRQEPLSVPTYTRDSARGASDFRIGFAPVGPFVHRSLPPSIQEMVPGCIQGPSATVGETHGQGYANPRFSEADH
jgi:hypothetical protein